MKLEELKAQATAILAIEPGSGFEHHTFACRTGGRPSNKVGVPTVHEGGKFEYDTVRHGGAYSGFLVVECRDTGAKDDEGRAIYLTPTGEVFVFRYLRGSAENFDRGWLIPPVMAVTAAREHGWDE